MEREKTRPAWPVGCLCATKLAQQAQNRRKTPFLGVLGELIRGRDVGRCVLGEFCTGIGFVCGTKFSLLRQNGLKWAFLGVLGEFCTGWADGPAEQGEFCTGWAAGVGERGEFCTGCAPGSAERGEFCTGFGFVCGTKFSLLGVVGVDAVQSSPCWGKTG